MGRPARWIFGPLAFVLLAAGCQRVNVEHTVQVEPEQVKAITIDPPRGDQKVSVTASSPGVPVSVYLVLEKDRQAAIGALENYKTPANVLASKEKVEQATLEATVPAKNGYAILLTASGGKKADVKLKVTGQ
jgi:hypothetical protein